jgi:phospholipase C
VRADTLTGRRPLFLPRRDSALCANYFCGVLSETYPNRLVLYSGTSGGNTSNDINNGTLNYPCVLDLLAAHGITFKNYTFG